MATAAPAAPPRAAVDRVDRSATPIVIGHDLPCPWCGHSHHFLPCEDCSCPAHEHYPGEV